MNHPFEKLSGLCTSKGADQKSMSSKQVAEPATATPPPSDKPKAIAGNPKLPPFLDVLVKRFPLAFNLRDRKPLKIGIAQDILAVFVGDSTCSNSALRKALRYYVMGRGYLMALVSGAARIDLDGNGAGEVSPEDHLHAEKLLASKVICPAPAPEPMNRVS
jgi:ProP effector